MDVELKDIINGFLEMCQYLCGLLLLFVGIHKILTNFDVHESILWIVFGLTLINNARIVSIDYKLDKIQVK